MARRERNEGKRKPCAAVRIGALSASIWRNKGDYGPWYSVNLQRSYKAKDSDEWQYSDTLNQDDLLTAGLLLQRAFLKIVELKIADREDGRDDDDDDNDSEIEETTSDDTKGKPKGKPKSKGKLPDDEIPY